MNSIIFEFVNVFIFLILIIIIQEPWDSEYY